MPSSGGKRAKTKAKKDGETNADGTPATRLLHVNSPEANAEYKYPNNYATTAKYNVWTFVFVNLFEQFRRGANVWFLIISALQQLPGISPTGKFTTVLPLCGVLLVTMVKEAIEDYYRHREDRRTNRAPVRVARDGEWKELTWEQVNVGDIVRVNNGEYIPADLVLLNTSEPQGMCYIETANLDGETNLKIRQALDETVAVATTDDAVLSFSDAQIECEVPNKRLYNFDATLRLGGAEHALSPKQLLLRGAALRNTGHALGVAVYTGVDTKLMRNSTSPPLKRSNVEKLANKQIFALFGIELLLSALCAVGSTVFQASSVGSNAWYLSLDDDGGASSYFSTWFFSWLTYIILYNNLIPISLYVSLELAKVGQAYFINKDRSMYYERNDTPALARTSNLNEELGQIQYIFSDKTGTLTSNQMTFRQCSIGGIAYGDESDGYVADAELTDSHDAFVQFDDKRVRDLAKAALKGDTSNADALAVKDFLRLLSVCHTVIPEAAGGGTSGGIGDDDVEKKSGKKGKKKKSSAKNLGETGVDGVGDGADISADAIEYQANSPDENALVRAAKHLGMFFYDRNMKYISVRNVASGAAERYELLNVLEFNSTRKRMSVIVRTPDDKIVLMCKGADTVIYERLAEGQKVADVTLTHLEGFARTGLRTLCCAQVELEEEAYVAWNKTFQAAATDIVDRDAKLDAAAEAIEKNLVLLGATAIEDKLQDGVPEAIATLADAGIQIWVLTGDKQETAINIAYSCRLFTQEMTVVELNAYTLDECRSRIEALLDEYAEGGQREDLALVIDGGTLLHALHDSLELKFLALGKLCKAVVACRVSPAQKAEVVLLVRNNEKAISLAIGDGANDVSMIQAAHVGVGISGEEGLQAARASDYAIAQFRFLVPLLLVHGRWSYRRNSKLILYSFYKNIVQQMTQLYFTTQNGWSGQTFYERWTLASFNAIFTSMPIIFFALLDRDVPAKYCLKYPPLYKIGQSQYHFGLPVFWKWVINALIHATIIFWLPVQIFAHGNAGTDGRGYGLYEVGVVTYSVLVVTVTGKVALESATWTWLNHLMIWGSLASWFLYQLIYSVMGSTVEVIGWDVTFLFYQVASSWLYWFTLVLVPVAALSFDVVRKYVKRTIFPRDYHIVQEIALLERKKNRHSRRSGDVSLHSSVGDVGEGGVAVTRPPASPSSGSLKKKRRKSHTGYAFEEDEGERAALESHYSGSLGLPEGGDGEHSRRSRTHSRGRSPPGQALEVPGGSDEQRKKKRRSTSKVRNDSKNDL